MLDVCSSDLLVSKLVTLYRDQQAINTFSTHLFLFVAQLPEYFMQKGWKNPDNIEDSPFNFAVGSDRGYFHYMSSNPYYQNTFDTVMASPYRRDEKSWLDFFPVEEKLQV